MSSYFKKINSKILKKFRALPFRLQGSLLRTTCDLFRLRLGSFPYISGDGFRRLAEIIIETPLQLERVKRLNIRPGSLLFVNGWLMPQFLRAWPFPDVPIVLITHNSDLGPGEGEASLWEERFHPRSVWFAQNARVWHPRIVPIPIGLENLRLGNHGLTRHFDSLRKRLPPFEQRIPKIAFGFAVRNNPGVRQAALESLRRSPCAQELPTGLNSWAYKRELIRYLAVACPEGNGLDTHRVWEAMYLRVMPVVVHSRLTEEWPRLPWLVLNSWRDVEEWNSLDLRRRYEAIPDPAWDAGELQIRNWIRKIAQAKSALQLG